MSNVCAHRQHIFFLSEAKKECVAKLQDLDGSVDWADTRQLRFNAGKCKVIRMGQSNPGYTYNMKTHGTGERVVLATSDTETDLGVLLEKELKFLFVCFIA